MPTAKASRQRAIKNSIGTFIHHPVTSLVVVLAILSSVSLVVVHFLIPEDSPWQTSIEAVQIGLTVLFFVELGTKYYVAPSKARFFANAAPGTSALSPSRSSDSSAAARHSFSCAIAARISTHRRLISKSCWAADDSTVAIARDPSDTSR